MTKPELILWDLMDALNFKKGSLEAVKRKLLSAMIDQYAELMYPRKNCDVSRLANGPLYGYRTQNILTPVAEACTLDLTTDPEAMRKCNEYIARMVPDLIKEMDRKAEHFGYKLSKTFTSDVQLSFVVEGIDLKVFAYLTHHVLPKFIARAGDIVQDPEGIHTIAGINNYSGAFVPKELLKKNKTRSIYDTHMVEACTDEANEKAQQWSLNNDTPMGMLTYMVEMEVNNKKQWSRVNNATKDI